MRKLYRYLAIVPVALLCALLAAPTLSFAHERRTIADGKYDVVVGWDVEPAFQGSRNGASIRISQSGTTPAVPVTGAEKTLKVRIKQGASTQEFPLRAVHGQQGYYVADVLPVRDGDYQWTFFGSIDDTAINDTFDTAEGKFNKVEATTRIAFPAGVAVEPAQAMAAAQAAQAEAQSARTFGFLGSALGVIGILAAATAHLSRPRGLETSSSTRPAFERS